MAVVLKQEGTVLWLREKVKDGGENIYQLVGTRSESTARDVVWSCCLVGVDFLQDSEYLT